MILIDIEWTSFGSATISVGGFTLVFTLLGECQCSLGGFVGIDVGKNKMVLGLTNF